MSASPSDRAVLPPPGDFPVLRGPLARLILRPYFDRASLYVISRWYMPLSRGWAAGVESGGAVESFAAATGLSANGGGMGRVLSALRDRQTTYEEASTRWEEAVFGPDDPGEAERTRREAARQNAAHRFMAGRLGFHRVRTRLAQIRWDIRGKDAVEEAHGYRLADPATAFPAPAPTDVAVSRPVRGAYGLESWLRFPSPSARLGDTAWARVYEPDGVTDPATLIFLHGICMETEMWKGSVDAVTELTRAGVRVVRPEGPFHGRRRLPGFYGGEPAIGRGPVGLIELFEGWVAEAAVLIDWARSTSKGPVAIGGLSLGALTSQLAATAAVHWPDRLKPDAKFLVVTSGDILATAYSGALPSAVGLPAKLAEAGWEQSDLDRWLPLLQPSDISAVPPERTVMHLGRVDTVTPFDGGRSLAERWGVPDDNVFIYPGGHFSAPLSQYHDTRPLDRLVEVLSKV